MVWFPMVSVLFCDAGSHIIPMTREKKTNKQTKSYRMYKGWIVRTANVKWDACTYNNETCNALWDRQRKTHTCRVSTK